MNKSDFCDKWQSWANEEDGIKIAKLIRADYYGCSMIDGHPVLLIKNMTYFKYYQQWLKLTLLSGLMHDHFSTSNFLNRGFYIKIDEFNIDMFQHNLREEKLKRILK